MIEDTVEDASYVAFDKYLRGEEAVVDGKSCNDFDFEWGREAFQMFDVVVSRGRSGKYGCKVTMQKSCWMV